MQLHTISFDVPRRDGLYDRLRRVLEYSARKNSPTTPLVVHELTRDDDPELLAHEGQNLPVKATYIDNARKTKHWWRIVREARDGQLLGLVDLDMMILGDLAPVTSLSFDIAYTVRPPGSHYPFNTGMVFLRKSPRVEAFFDLWYRRVLLLLENQGLLRSLTPRYGGINQAAFGWMLSVPGLEIGELPCSEWNFENECTNRCKFDDRVRAVHILGNVRRQIQHGDSPASERHQRLADLWRNMEHEQEQLALHAVG